MHYFYAAIFALLITPMETIVKGVDGVFYGDWRPFEEAIKTGALYAYAAILSAETLLRSALLPSIVRQKYPKMCEFLFAISFLICFFAGLFFVLLLITGAKADVRPFAHYVALIFSSFALILVFAAIWLDHQGKVLMSEALIQLSEQNIRASLKGSR